jgi:hypothetical protein
MDPWLTLVSCSIIEGVMLQRISLCCLMDSGFFRFKWVALFLFFKLFINFILS